MFQRTLKASYYTSNGKGRKIEITPRPSEVKINRKRLIYVPKWIITIKAGKHPYNRKALAAASNTKALVLSLDFTRNVLPLTPVDFL